MTGNSNLNIPTLWVESDSSEFEYEHDIEDVTVYLQSKSEGGVKQVGEGEKFPRPDEGETVWAVKIDTGSRDFSHGPNQDTESEAERLAAEFMRDFSEAYEDTNGDVDEALSEAMSYN